jgi:hypothetical protein
MPQGPWVTLWRHLVLPPDVSEAAAVPLSCLGAPPRRTRLEWCGWNRTPFPLLSWVSSATSFSGSPPSHFCSPNNWRYEVFLPPPTGSCSMLGWKIYSLSRITPCAGDHPALQAAGRLLAVCVDVAELLAVMALRKTILSSICLCPDCDVAEALQSENFLGFCRHRKVTRKRGGL